MHRYYYSTSASPLTRIEKIVIGLAGIGWLYVFLYDSADVALFYSGLFVFSVVARKVAGMDLWMSLDNPPEIAFYSMAALVTLLLTNSFIFGMTGSYSVVLSTGSPTIPVIGALEVGVIAPLLRSIFIAVAEEETFRGIVLDRTRTLIKADDWAFLIIISGVGFSLAHAKSWYGAQTISEVFPMIASNPAPFMVGVAGGTILGITALKARNLLPTIVAHALYDFMAFVRI